jgi:hypothetical protein
MFATLCIENFSYFCRQNSMLKGKIMREAINDLLSFKDLYYLDSGNSL